MDKQKFIFSQLLRDIYSNLEYDKMFTIFEVLYEEYVKSEYDCMKEFLNNGTIVTITRQNFLDWYFGYGSDQENEELMIDLGKCVLKRMYKNKKGIGVCCVEELFHKAEHTSIVAGYCEEFEGNNESELSELFDNFKIKLI